MKVEWGKVRYFTQCKIIEKVKRVDVRFESFLHDWMDFYCTVVYNKKKVETIILGHIVGTQLPL